MPHIGPILEGRGASDYERYVRVPELLELQKPIDKLSHPEERLFQVMHQSAELWLHHIDYEIRRAADHLSGNRLEEAADLLHRCTLIIDLLREQVVILETMAPADYHVIRTTALGRGSGQESPGFATLLGVGALLWPAFEEARRRAGVTVIEVQREPRKHPVMYRLVQSMMDYDAAFMKWRFTHMRLAFRVIGSRVLSLKGVPADQLQHGTREEQFPELWAAISELTAEFKPTY